MSQMTHPCLVIAMGVSGSGKTTMAEKLAERYAFLYVEADDFHSDDAKQKMQAGIPLTDEDRLPWIARLCDHLTQQALQQQSCVLSYSGLRAAHRQSFRELPFATHFLFLNGSQELILQRMNAREDHYMPASLLQSQFDGLQSPDAEEDVTEISIDASPDAIFAHCEQVLQQWLVNKK
ncbi:gluconokinase [Alteromonadaceae bacterium BrNp21-10]|nr:gluconokinase [Alteromonadaceae bacterium BrNp21-10]